jgi:hypothetical protein
MQVVQPVNYCTNNTHLRQLDFCPLLFLCLVLMCSCAHVLMCSCAHVLMCSCTHVRLIVCAFVGVQNTCICTVHLCKYSCKLIVVELWAAGARSRTCKNETPFYTRLYEPGIVMSRLTHNIEHFYGEFSI